MRQPSRWLGLLMACGGALRIATLPPALGARSQPRIDSVRSLPIVELRQYTLLPGKREVLIDLFEREFIEGQEQTGIIVLGQFRDLDRPDVFVWLRGFTDMPSRAHSLAAFYDGPIWKMHGPAANATMIDSTNVLMLQPAQEASGFRVDAHGRPPQGTNVAPSGIVTAVVYPFANPVDAQFIAFFDRSVRPVIETSGGRVLATFVTNPSPNNYPRLPIREGERVFVWFAAFGSEAAHTAFLATNQWRRVSAEVDRRLSGKAAALRLTPTPRSLVGR